MGTRILILKAAIKKREEGTQRRHFLARAIWSANEGTVSIKWYDNL